MQTKNCYCCFVYIAYTKSIYVFINMSIVAIIILSCVMIITFIVLLWYFLDMFVSLIRSRGVPYVPSFDKDLELMSDTLWLQPGKSILDLWCGDGKALRYLVKKYDLTSWVGYEISIHAYLRWIYINWKKSIQNITIIHQSMYKADPKKYDYIYCYLMPFIMPSMEKWLEKNCRPGTVIISNTFPLPNRKPDRIIKNKKGKDKIFLYTA